MAMIVRYESDGSIVMITQNDHAQLSGLFAAHWGNEKFEKPRPYPSLVRAAMFHDRGWIRYETSPQLNLETGTRLLLMDEPFGALDAMTREQMNLELMRIWSKSGKTVIFITHSIAEAIFLSDRVIAMTARPGTIADVITINLPRPRELSVINTDRFGRYAAKLRSLLDAQEGMF
jgi:hypothetical protein